jgi:indole-3-glycerol phosphate synthase
MTISIPNRLIPIVSAKKKEVGELYNSGRAAFYFRNVKVAPKLGFFESHITRENSVLNLIAEFKKASPSKGDIRPGAEPEEIVKLYEKCGAAAISVLTNSFFKGEIGYIDRVKAVINLPVLCKEFIRDPVQIYEARYHGADAILLIAAILEKNQIRDYIALADGLGMDCLVESHNMSELEKSIAAGARIFGINNRDLTTFKVDINTTLQLSPYVPSGRPIVAESGISTYEHVKKLSVPGVRAMLVGEGIMSLEINPTLKDMERTLYELQGRFVE